MNCCGAACTEGSAPAMAQATTNGCSVFKAPQNLNNEGI
jgi:hypothetical protein